MERWGAVAVGVLVLLGVGAAGTLITTSHPDEKPDTPGPVDGKSPDEMITDATGALDRVDHRVIRMAGEDDRSRIAYDYDDREILIARNGTGPEGRTVSVTYAADETLAACIQQNTGFDPRPEACRGIDVRSFELQNVTGDWWIDADQGYRDVRDRWELRPQELVADGVDWQVRNRTADWIVLIATDLPDRLWGDRARARIDRETGYLKRLVVRGRNGYRNRTVPVVYRFEGYGSVDVSRPEGV